MPYSKAFTEDVTHFRMKQYDALAHHFKAMADSMAELDALRSQETRARDSRLLEDRVAGIQEITRAELAAQKTIDKLPHNFVDWKNQYKVGDIVFVKRYKYEDGILKIDADEELESAILFDGTAYYEIGDGIELPYGAYEVTVTSTTGQTYTEVVGISPKVEHSILPMIALFASIATLGVLTVLVIRKYRKELVQA